MNLKKIIKTVQRALARCSLFAFAWLLKGTPYPVVRAMGTVCTVIGFQFILKQRRIARESLEIAFCNEKSAAEIKEISWRCFSNLGQGMMEMLYFLAHPKKTAGHVFFEGKKYLDEALSQGKGVVAVTAHFGNFPLMMLHCAQEGYPVNSIIRPARDEKLEKYLFRKRKECGVKTVYAMPRKECVTQSLQVLRNNEILFIPLDQNFGSGGGVFVDFFGQKAATATGPVVFAARTGALILPMFIIRQLDHTHKIMIEPPIQLEQTGNDDRDIEMNIAKITHLIEQYIRKYPHEWGWMHRRWKTKEAKK